MATTFKLANEEVPPITIQGVCSVIFLSSAATLLQEGNKKRRKASPVNGTAFKESNKTESTLLPY